jgi:hypothetical protein
MTGGEAMARIPGNAKRAIMARTKGETTRTTTAFGVFLIDMLNMTFMEGIKFAAPLSTIFSPLL